jgi:hypothetical protein
MEKRASNTFVAGLNSDRHPLTAQNTELIEARNIDLVAVGEGYQLILQKREGNLEVLIVPPAYDATKIYYIGEYVLYNNLAYKALTNGEFNKRPDISPTKWEALTGRTVPAGLKEGFIPLAVEEINNIAYIVSVKPDPDPKKVLGEVGTFPSPDYDLFKYEIGALAPNHVVIEIPIWDPSLDAVDYAFTVTEITVPDEEVRGFEDPGYQLTQQFTIKNTGLLEDTFILNASGYEAGVDVYVNAAPYAAPFLLGSGDSAIVTLKVVDPFIHIPEVKFSNYVIVTTTDGPITNTHTFTYVWHTSTALQVKRNAGWGDPPNLDYTYHPTSATSNTLQDYILYSKEVDVNWDCRSNNRYFHQDPWVNVTPYSVGNYTVDGGLTYRSIINSNTGNQPSLTVGVAWEVVAFNPLVASVIPDTNPGHPDDTIVTFIMPTLIGRMYINGEDPGISRQSIWFIDGTFPITNDYAGGTVQVIMKVDQSPNP